MLRLRARVLPLLIHSNVTIISYPIRTFSVVTSSPNDVTTSKTNVSSTSTSSDQPKKRGRSTNTSANESSISTDNNLLQPSDSSVKPKKTRKSVKTDSSTPTLVPVDTMETKRLDAVFEDIPELSKDLKIILSKTDGLLRVEHFPTYFHTITQPKHIKWSQIPTFITSSRDINLLINAKKTKSALISSSSSTTPLLSHLHFLLTNFRCVNLQNLSSVFQEFPPYFTFSVRAPSTVLLRRRRIIKSSKHSEFVEPLLQLEHLQSPEAFQKYQNLRSNEKLDKRKIYECWAFDNESCSDQPNVILLQLGNSLEKMFTMEPEDFNEKMILNNEIDKNNLSETQDLLNNESSQNVKESSKELQSSNKKEKKTSKSKKTKQKEFSEENTYTYSKMSNMLLRSQLDCRGIRDNKPVVFDLKTRATVPIRLDVRNHTDYTSYELIRSKGIFCSFEREYFDMMRSAFLSYSLQAKIGAMDGIMVAYHNTKKIFGFQYITLQEMENILCGNQYTAKHIYDNSVLLLEIIMKFIIKNCEKITLNNKENKKTEKKKRIKTNEIDQNNENNQNNKIYENNPTITNTKTVRKSKHSNKFIFDTFRVTFATNMKIKNQLNIYVELTPPPDHNEMFNINSLNNINNQNSQNNESNENNKNIEISDINKINQNNKTCENNQINESNENEQSLQISENINNDDLNEENLVNWFLKSKTAYYRLDELNSESLKKILKQVYKNNNKVDKINEINKLTRVNLLYNLEQYLAPNESQTLETMEYYETLINKGLIKKFQLHTDLYINNEKILNKSIELNKNDQFNVFYQLNEIVEYNNKEFALEYDSIVRDERLIDQQVFDEAEELAHSIQQIINKKKNNINQTQNNQTTNNVNNNENNLQNNTNNRNNNDTAELNNESINTNHNIAVNEVKQELLQNMNTSSFHYSSQQSMIDYTEFIQNSMNEYNNVNISDSNNNINNNNNNNNNNNKNNNNNNNENSNNNNNNTNNNIDNYNTTTRMKFLTHTIKQISFSASRTRANSVMKKAKKFVRDVSSFLTPHQKHIPLQSKIFFNKKSTSSKSSLNSLNQLSSFVKKRSDGKKNNILTESVYNPDMDFNKLTQQQKQLKNNKHQTSHQSNTSKNHVKPSTTSTSSSSSQQNTVVPDIRSSSSVKRHTCMVLNPTKPNVVSANPVKPASVNNTSKPPFITSPTTITAETVTNLNSSFTTNNKPKTVVLTPKVHVKTASSHRSIRRSTTYHFNKKFSPTTESSSAVSSRLSTIINSAVTRIQQRQQEITHKINKYQPRRSSHTQPTNENK